MIIFRVTWRYIQSITQYAALLSVKTDSLLLFQIADYPTYSALFRNTLNIYQYPIMVIENSQDFETWCILLQTCLQS